MIDYAWREAQWQEVRAAMRAAVAAAAPLFSGAPNAATTRQIQERIAGFASGLVADLDITPERVELTYDAATGVYTIVARGVFPFERIWHGGRDPEPVADTIKVAQDSERIEVAIAVDVSWPMEERTPWGDRQAPETRGYWRKFYMVSKALKEFADEVEGAGGNVMLSLVPYGATVNVADTCDPDPRTGECRGRQTPDKIRYLKMVLGYDYDDPHTLGALGEFAPRNDPNNGHWVAAYHEYGVSSRSGHSAAALPAGASAAGQQPGVELREGLPRRTRRTSTSSVPTCTTTTSPG